MKKIIQITLVLMISYLSLSARSLVKEASEDQDIVNKTEEILKMLLSINKHIDSISDHLIALSLAFNIDIETTNLKNKAARNQFEQYLKENKGYFDKLNAYIQRQKSDLNIVEALLTKVKVSPKDRCIINKLLPKIYETKSQIITAEELYQKGIEEISNFMNRIGRAEQDDL